MEQKIFLSHTRKIHFINISYETFVYVFIKERALIYFEEFFHAIGLFISDAIELVKISKIFRNRKKGGGQFGTKCVQNGTSFIKQRISTIGFRKYYNSVVYYLITCFTF